MEVEGEPTHWAKKNFLKEADLPRAKEIIDEWLREGVVKIREEPVTHTYSLLAVEKKDEFGKKTDIRLCVDLRPLNKIMKDTHYPLPTIPEIIATVGKFKGKKSRRSKVDCTAAYQRLRCIGVPICFVFDGVIYQFLVAMFGAKPMTSIFQRVADDIARPLKVVRPYVDDFSFGSTSQEEAIVTAVKLIERLTAFGIVVNQKKSRFAVTNLKLLGHDLGPQGVKMSPEKVQSLLEWPEPQTGKQVMANYYRAYIRNFSVITAPLDALRQKAKIQLSDKERTAFTQLKEEIAENILLAYPEPARGIYIGVDASESGVGAWRGQLKEEFIGLDEELVDESHLDILEFASKAFPAGKNYSSATVRELQGCIFALKKFLPHLYGREFILFTDHSALVHLFTKKDPSPLWSRWIDLLQSLTFKVIHWKGENNVMADALSRQFESSSTLVEKLIMHGKVEPSETEKVEKLEKIHALGHFGKQQLFLQVWIDGF